MTTRSTEFAPLALLPRPKPKLRKPPRKVRAAIEILVTGQVRTITAAAKKVGLTRERLSRAFSEPHIAEALRQRAAREVAMGSAHAAARLNELVDASSQKVALEATKYSLGVAGIKPAADSQVNVNLEIRAGYVIDLSEPDDAPAAAKLIDGKLIEGEVIVGPKPVDEKPE